MKNNFFSIKFFLLFVFVFLGSALLVRRAFVYDAPITHAGLTKLAGELYNKDAKRKLTAQEVGWLAQGAIEEDTPLRWMNHFYDPINNRGLGGTYDSAKVWATNYNNQVNYSRGNNTWQEAIYQYQKGDKEKAFIALGHILHLLEDMTVPAHTRDDAHPEGDPYEVWARQNYHDVEAQMIYYNSLNKYFDYLANFSNNNFFSKDSIKNFVKPDLNLLELKKDCYYANNNPRICFVIDDLSNDKSFYLDGKIAESYFSLLAPKAVGAGAGVIKLFFEEAQKPQKYNRPFWQITLSGIIQQQTAGAVVPMAGNIKDRTTDAFNQVLNSAKGLITDVTNANKIWDLLSNLWKTNNALAMDFKDLSEIKNNFLTAPVKIAGQAIDTVQNSFNESALISEKAYQVLKNLDASGSSSNYFPAPSSPQPVVPVNSPTESNVNLSDVYFLPEPTASTQPLNNYSYYNYGGSGGGSYSSSEGGSSNSSSLENSNSGNEHTPEPPNNYFEENSTSTFSNTSTSTLEIIDNENSTSTVSTTSTLEMGDFDSTSSTPETIFTDTASSTLEIPTATSIEEINTTSTPETSNPPPEESAPAERSVVISEIAWGGTQAGPNDEWIELYNITPANIDLSGWMLTDGNDIKFVFPTSTFIGGGTYFLMERTNDSTVATAKADIIYTGSLRDSGEKLTLKNSAGSVVDEVNFSSRWPAGRNEYNRESMERKSFAASGSDPNNWQNSPMAVWQGKDAMGNYIAGTPGSANSNIIYLNGILTADRILNGGIYVLGFCQIPSGVTLKISAGTKILGDISSNIKVSGKLEVLGNSENPVIFTSYNDGGMGNIFYKQDVNWGYLQVLSGGQADIRNAKFNFGNSKFDTNRPKGLIYADNALLNLDGVTFDKNLNEKPRGDWPLINANNSYLEIKNSHFLDSPKGLIVKGGNLSLTGNSFEGLGLSAVESEDLTTALIENNDFKNLGWEYMKREYWERPLPLLSPVSFKNFLPETIKGNTFENDIINSWEVYGKLSASGKIDTLGEAPVVLALLEIPTNKSLEIKDGSIIKIIPSSSINVFGKLLSNGAANKIVFTSLHDDEYGGNIDLAEETIPQKEGNEWKRIWIKSSEQSIFNNTLVRYANAAISETDEGSVFVDGSSLTAQGLTIEYSRVPGVALHLKNSNAVVDGCLMRNDTKRTFDPTVYNDGSGIWVNGGSPKISNCIIDTFNFGIRLNPESTPELSNIEYKNVDLTTGL